MRLRQDDSWRPPVVAIVGGGASGTLTAVHLLRHAAWQRTALQVVLIDRQDRHGLGQAYSTGHAGHLLNTMAFQTSALPDEPDHLVRWSGEPATTFLPRLRYGQYLRDTLADAERQARHYGKLVRVDAEVATASVGQGAVRLTGAEPFGRLDADLAVLALGNISAGLPFAAPASSRVIRDPWRAGELERISDGRPVVIVGTGLTMIDIALAVTSQSPDSSIYAVSRHGLLPRPHPGRPPGDQPVWLPAMHTAPKPVRLPELMGQVRAAVAVDPACWYDVVSALRPQLPDLWHRLPLDDKRLFLRHVARYWEVHRHLMPPAIARRVAALQESGQLSVVAGRVAGVTGSQGGLCVHIGQRGALSARARHRCAEVTDLKAGWIVSAAGGPADIAATSDPLLRHLFASGLARPDPLHLGLDATTYGAIIDATGAPSETLFTLGPPLRGLWYETTAMPEIRAQAAVLARRIAADRRISRPGGRAA